MERRTRPARGERINIGRLLSGLAAHDKVCFRSSATQRRAVTRGGRKEGGTEMRLELERLRGDRWAAPGRARRRAFARGSAAPGSTTGGRHGAASPSPQHEPAAAAPAPPPELVRTSSLSPSRSRDRSKRLRKKAFKFVPHRCRTGPTTWSAAIRSFVAEFKPSTSSTGPLEEGSKVSPRRDSPRSVPPPPAHS